MRGGERERGAQGRRLLLLISQLLNLSTSQSPNFHLLNLSHPGRLNNMERKADTFCF